MVGDDLPSRVREATRRLAATLAAGFVGGLIVAGVGGRFFMRAIGATSDEDAQGRLTEAGEVVGRVTLGGSIFFVFLGAGIGSLGALGLYAARAWLPRRSVVAGLVVAGIGAGLLARPTELLAPESVDFEILGPLWFAVLFALLLIVLLGSATTVLADRWVRRWPAPALSIQGVAGLVPLVPLIVLGPGVVVVPVLVACRTTWPESVSGGRRATVIGTGLLIAAAVGWAWTLAAGVEIVG